MKPNSFFGVLEKTIKRLKLENIKIIYDQKDILKMLNFYNNLFIKRDSGLKRNMNLY